MEDEDHEAPIAQRASPIVKWSSESLVMDIAVEYRKVNTTGARVGFPTQMWPNAARAASRTLTSRLFLARSITLETTSILVETSLMAIAGVTADRTAGEDGSLSGPPSVTIGSKVPSGRGNDP